MGSGRTPAGRIPGPPVWRLSHRAGAGGRSKACLVELPQDALVDGSGFMRQGFKSWTTHRDRTVCIRKLVGFGPGLAARIMASFNMAADTTFLRPDNHTTRPAARHEQIGPDRKSTRLNSRHYCAYHM